MRELKCPASNGVGLTSIRGRESNTTLKVIDLDVISNLDPRCAQPDYVDNLMICAADNSALDKTCQRDQAVQW